MHIHIDTSKAAIGAHAAACAAEHLRAAIDTNGAARLVVATGASQFELLGELVRAPAIDWSRVTAFHLDEYVGIDDSHPASFRRYIRERFVDCLPAPLEAMHYLHGERDPQAECNRVGAAISQRPIDVALIGIGENAHLAFNDPTADFTIRKPYHVVELDKACRRQQVGEGWFATLDDVPRRAISMTISQILASQCIVCTVPDLRKAAAVRAAVEGPITPEVPASALQQHEQTFVFLDTAAASLLDPANRGRG